MLSIKLPRIVWRATLLAGVAALTFNGCSKKEAETVIDPPVLVTADKLKVSDQDFASGAYEKLLGAYWNSLPTVTGSQSSTIFLNGVKSGVVIVNVNASAYVDNNGNGNVAGVQIEVRWRRGRTGKLDTCTIDRDIANPIWRGTFAVTGSCFLIIPSDGDYTLEIVPLGIQIPRPAPPVTYSARYLLVNIGEAAK